MNIKTKSPGKFTFFYLVVASALVILSVFAFQSPKSILRTDAKNNKQSITFNLAAGLNAIAIPLRTNLTADDICKIDSSITFVNKFVDGEWNEYDCALPTIPDFEILENVGYFIKADIPVNLTVNGIATNSNVTLSPGLNFFGLSQLEGAPQDASSVCSYESSYRGKTASVIAVHEWINGGWSSHYCLVPELQNINNFSILEGRAYFIDLGVESKVKKSIPKL